MKLSTKGRYGLRILLDVAMYGVDQPRMIRDIAESQEISEKYISRLIVDLRKAGLLKSIRGARGGYKLAVPAEMITVLDVVEVMEGPISIVDCIADSSVCAKRGDCLAAEVWSKVNDNIRTSLAGVTLNELLQQHR